MLNNNIEDVFEDVGMSYRFNTKTSYDNIESMRIFVERIYKLEVNNIFIDDGTMVVLEHPDYDYRVRLDSGGEGDFKSHIIETSIYVE